MPVGSEWWGAKTVKAFETKKNMQSPMPVGSEWWGARNRKALMLKGIDGVANACRQ